MTLQIKPQPSQDAGTLPAPPIFRLARVIEVGLDDDRAIIGIVDRSTIAATAPLRCSGHPGIDRARIEGRQGYIRLRHHRIADMQDRQISGRWRADAVMNDDAMSRWNPVLMRYARDCRSGI